MQRTRRGFTLIELLVVITIMGIILGIVIANIVASRSISRDETRLENLASIQTALALYKDKNGVYPPTLTGLLGSDNFIASIPEDPNTGAAYTYAALKYSAGTACVTYHLGATLENKNSQMSQSNDFNLTYSTLGSACAGSVSDFDAASSSPCGLLSGSGGYCYDVIK